MQIRFSITKGYPMDDPGETVPVQTFDQQLIPVGRLSITDFNENNLDHINFMFEGGYQVWFISESKGPRITLKLPSKS
jgi:hypothetical protein